MWSFATDGPVRAGGKNGKIWDNVPNRRGKPINIFTFLSRPIQYDHGLMGIELYAVSRETACAGPTK